MNKRETVGLDPNEVVPALRGIKTGERVIYHIGHLANDRGGGLNSNVAQMAKLATELSNQGRVKLFQRRLGPPVHNGSVDWKFGVGPGFEYVAVGI